MHRKLLNNYWIYIDRDVWIHEKLVVLSWHWVSYDCNWMWKYLNGCRFEWIKKVENGLRRDLYGKWIDYGYLEIK